MQFFKRWRRARSPKAADVEPEAGDAELVQPVQKQQKQSVPRGRRPATMGKSMAEQAYLAKAAQRAKQGP